jgi:hypothetical protein
MHLALEKGSPDPTSSTSRTAPSPLPGAAASSGAEIESDPGVVGKPRATPLADPGDRNETTPSAFFSSISILVVLDAMPPWTVIKMVEGSV